MAKIKRNWFSRLGFAAAALIVSALLPLSYVSALINPERGWLFSLFGLLFLPLALTTLLFLLWAIKRRSRTWILLFLMLLPSIFLSGRYYQIRRGESEEGAIRIVSYNVGLFAHGDGKRMETADSVAAALKTLDADIICLQEFYLPNSVGTEQWIKTHFPGYYSEYYVLTGKNGRAGNLTLSKFPVSGKGKISFENSTNLALYTELDLPMGKYRVYNCHFESYNISVSHLLTSVREEEELIDTGRKVRRSIRQRPKQVNAVVKDIEGSGRNALVLGDFNDTPISYTYHRLSKGRKDSFVAAGKGFGASYREFWPLLRIDYVLLPSGLDACSHKTLKLRHSDHYPIIVTCNES